MRWTGFLVGLLALSLWGCPSAAEREQRAAERAKKEAAKADEALEQLTAVAAALPARSALREAACPAGTDARTLGYVPVDVDYLRQFKASGFEPMKDLPTYRKYFAQEKDYTGVWFRDTDWSQLQAGIQADPRGDHTIAHAWFEVLWTSSKPGDGLKEAPNGHLAVIYTSREKLPAISNYPGKGDVILDPAEFSGWVVLVEPQSATVLCQARFQAANSEHVSFTLGEDPLAEAFEDFERQFSKAIEAALAEQGAKLERYRW